MVLVVEDDDRARKLYRDLLGALGYSVIEAADGIEAVRLSAERMPDLVIMDLKLPLIDGGTAAGMIKANPATMHTPIIAVTASANKGQEPTAQASACDDCIYKPFDIDVLATRISDFLKRRT